MSGEKIINWFERRKHPRVKTNQGFFVMQMPDHKKIGQVFDISEGGFSFVHTNPSFEKETFFSLCIASPESDIIIDNIPVRIIFDLKIPADTENEFCDTTLRRCGVKFGLMDGEQKKQLKHIMRHHIKWLKESEDTKKKKILIADDEKYLHKMYSRLVNGNSPGINFELLHAYDGEEAMTIATIQKPDIIILDINMPRMDGRTVCQKLKSSPDTKNIKIIMLTGEKVEQHDRLVGFEVGADDYLIKPCNVETIRLRIRRALRK